MTSTRRDLHTSKQCPSSTQPGTLNQSNNSIKSSHSSPEQHQHQQHDTPRAKRFSQKLVDAAKKQPLARTPSTSASLSPPLESCMTDENDDLDDDYAMADIDSTCFASPNRDDQFMNSHFQNMLLSSPLRPDLTMMRPLQLDDSHSSTIPDEHSQLHDGLNRPGQLDKRSVKHQHVSDTPSVSGNGKPKRRKLKKQGSSSRQTDTTAPLNTNGTHLPVEPNPQRSVSPTPPSSSPVPVQQQGNTRRSSRLANRKVSYGESTNHKKPLVVLGIPAGVKTETEPATTLYDDGDHCGRSVSSSNSSSNEHQKPSRRMRRRVDTVEQRLNQLIFARDTLDLSQHSVLPTSGDKATQESNNTVMVIDDSDDEIDSRANNSPAHFTKKAPEKMDTQHDAFRRETSTNDDKHLHHADDTLRSKVKLEPTDEIVDLVSTPSSPTLSQNDVPVSTVTIIEEDTDMANIDEKPTQPPSTDTEHTQDEQEDGDCVMADAEQGIPPKVDDTHQDIQLPAPSSPSSPTSKDDPLLSDTTNTLLSHKSNLPSTGNTIRAPSLSPSPISSTPSELNHPVPVSNSPSKNCSTTKQDTETSTNDVNHKQLQPAASASASAIASSSSSSSMLLSLSSLPGEASPPPAPKDNPITTNADASITGHVHPPSQQAKNMHAVLTNDENSAPASGDQNSATTTSTQSAVETGNSSIGSSEATTLFGRLIGSASHFFLGN